MSMPHARALWVLGLGMALQWWSRPGLHGLTAAASASPHGHPALPQIPATIPRGFQAAEAEALHTQDSAPSKARQSPGLPPGFPPAALFEIPVATPQALPFPQKPSRTPRAEGERGSAPHHQPTMPCPAAVSPILHPRLIKTGECTTMKTEKCSP